MLPFVSIDAPADSQRRVAAESKLHDTAPTSHGSGSCAYDVMPYQVDGDLLGEVDHLVFRHHPDAVGLVVPEETCSSLLPARRPTARSRGSLVTIPSTPSATSSRILPGRPRSRCSAAAPATRSAEQLDVHEGVPRVEGTSGRARPWTRGRAASPPGRTPAAAVGGPSSPHPVDGRRDRSWRRGPRHRCPRRASARSSSTTLSATSTPWGTWSPPRSPGDVLDLDVDAHRPGGAATGVERHRQLDHARRAIGRGRLPDRSLIVIPRIVVNDEDAVSGAAHVQLHPVGALRGRSEERILSVLLVIRRGSPVGDD